jgi:membrane-associated phospholipid phosphatase
MFFLSTLVPFDAAVYNWIEAHRSCTTTHLFLAEWPLGSLIVLNVLTLIWLGYQRRWTEGTHGVVVIVLGSLLAELLKTVFERARPSTLPPLFIGNSFPSGHTVGAFLLAGTLGYFLLQQRTTIWKKGIGGSVLLVCVALVIWQRLYLAHHWLSDIVGSAWFASAWFCFAAVRPPGRSLARHFVPACVGFVLAYPLVYYFPTTRVALPSVMSSTREPVVSFSFGDVASTASFQGAWGQQSQEPTGSIRWMYYGEASLKVELPARQTYVMQLAVRPAIAHKEHGCFPLDISMNDAPVQRVLLHRGWRRYEVPLDSALLTPGANTLTFRTWANPSPTGKPAVAVAFRQLALFVEAKN